jgi:hypothetical protein
MPNYQKIIIEHDQLHAEYTLKTEPSFANHYGITKTQNLRMALMLERSNFDLFKRDVSHKIFVAHDSVQGAETVINIKDSLGFKSIGTLKKPINYDSVSINSFHYPVFKDLKSDIEYYYEGNVRSSHFYERVLYDGSPFELLFPILPKPNKYTITLFIFIPKQGIFSKSFYKFVHTPFVVSGSF